MALARDRCICLRKFEYSETSQILSLFGREHGLLRAIAKGAHRRTKAGASKFDGGVDLLDGGEAVFTYDTGRDLQTLTEWRQTDGHLELRGSLRAVYLAQYAAELVAGLMEEHDPHQGLFDRLEQTIKGLAGDRREEVFLAFELELLRETGHLPELAACTACGRLGVASTGTTAHFSPNNGGLVCGQCEPTVPDRLAIDARLIRLLTTLLQLPREGGQTRRLPHLTRHQTDPLNRLLMQYVQSTVGRGLRLGRYVVPSQHAK